jgi:plastocyanin
MRRPLIPALGFAAALALAACGGGASTTPTATQAAGTPAASAPQSAATEGAKVEIKGFAFNPATVTAKVGEEITWTNSDTAAHTVTLDDKSVDSGNIAQNATFKHAFSAAGTFSYHCSIHSNMKGTITVG